MSDMQTPFRVFTTSSTIVRETRRASSGSPASFTFLESAMVLAAVVLGGPGSVGGVSAAALVLVLLPEYLRPFAHYRMLVFGAALVLMMILRVGRGSPRPTRGGAP